GGPVYLGPLYDGHNRTFWFVAYEGLRNRQETSATGTVPTAAMWGGDFSNIVNASGVQTHIYDPYTTDARGLRQQFANDIIPASRLVPFFKQLQPLMAAPTNSVNPYLGNNLEKLYPNKSDTNTFTIKGDHRFSDRDNLSVRFSRSVNANVLLGGRFGLPAE